MRGSSPGCVLPVMSSVFLQQAIPELHLSRLSVDVRTNKVSKASLLKNDAGLSSLLVGKQ